MRQNQLFYVNIMTKCDVHIKKEKTHKTGQSNEFDFIHTSTIKNYDVGIIIDDVCVCILYAHLILPWVFTEQCF